MFLPQFWERALATWSGCQYVMAMTEQNPAHLERVQLDIGVAMRQALDQAGD
jgi:hypothetical protein